MNTAIYARFSSAKQDEASIDAQVRACREYAAAKGYIVNKVYTDEAISGKGSKTLRRKQYQALLRDCEKGLYNIVLVHKYDRIARNVGEHVSLDMRLSEAGVTLIAVAQDFGQTKESKIIKTLMWSLSEYYIENLAAETQKGHRETALKALHNGGYPPFGYDVVEQKYIINETEAAYVREMYECAVRGEGFVDLIAEMEAAGIKGKRCRPIRYPQVYEILKNEKYTGTYTYSMNQEKVRSRRREKPNAIKIENALPKIIDRALYEEVQKIMTTRKQVGTKSDYLCSGLVYCGSCGAKMYGSTTRRKDHEYRIYSCSAKCGAGIVHMDKVDETVQKYIKELLSIHTITKVNAFLQEYAAGQKKRIGEFNQSIRAEIADKQKQVDHYIHTLGSGALPNELISDIGNKITALKEEIKNLYELPVPKDYTVEQIVAWMEELRASTDERKTIKLLVERIDATKTAVNVTSTLTAVLGETGCGGSQHCFPTILFSYSCRDTDTAP